VAPNAIDNPFAFGQTIGVLDRLVRGSTDVVILGDAGDARAEALHRAAFAGYVANRNVAWVDPSNPASLAAAPLLTRDKPSDTAPRAFVCRGRTCSAPVTEPSELLALLAPSNTTRL
jgi:uncharacterized protein YyaL (SSP411 family)